MFEIPIVDDSKSTTNRRSGVMLCYPFEEKRLRTWKPPYIIQPKLDGVRCRALCTNEGVTLVSSENHVIDLVPHINEALVLADGTLELDGELYVHGMNFQDIFSRTSRKKNIHSDSSKIEFHIFDIVSTYSQIDRLAELNKIGFFLRAYDCIKVVPSSIVRDLDEVMKMYEEYLTKGYEGFILRDLYAGYARKRFTGIMKFKPHQEDEYDILGTQEELSIDGVPKNSLGAITCRGNDNTAFNVGTGFTRDQRIDLWRIREELVGKKLRVKFQALTQGRGVPRFPVAMEVIT